MNRALVSRSEEETRAAGRELARALISRPRPAFVRLTGDLGAGKTAFARGFILEWLALSGEPAPELVTSPTFNIARVYGQKAPVAHLDLYRVKTMEELQELGFEHYFYELGCCLVEWLEQVPGATEQMPPGALEVELTFGAAANERGLTVRETKAAS